MSTVQKYKIDQLRQGSNEIRTLDTLNKLHALLDDLIAEQVTYTQAGYYPEDFYIKMEGLFSSIDEEIRWNTRFNNWDVLRSNPSAINIVLRQAQEQIPALEKILVLMREIQQVLQPAIDCAVQKEGEVSMKDAIQRTIEHVENYLQKDRENCEKWSPGGEFYEAEMVDRKDRLQRTAEISERRHSIFGRAREKK